MLRYKIRNLEFNYKITEVNKVKLRKVINEKLPQ